MKILAVTFVLTSILIVGCKKEDLAIDESSIDFSVPIKSINDMKNGKPFINYLGAKMEGC